MRLRLSAALRQRDVSKENAHLRVVHDISPTLPRAGSPDPRDAGAIDTIVLHCTGVPGWNVWDVATYHAGPNHMSPEGCPCIAYAYFVASDGQLFRCLPHDVRSWHVGPWNDRSIGVCLEYEGGESSPPPEQLEAAADLCACLVVALGLDQSRVLGHRELEGTGYEIIEGEIVPRKECPGAAIDMDRFRSMVGRALERSGGPGVVLS